MHCLTVLFDQINSNTLPSVDLKIAFDNKKDNMCYENKVYEGELLTWIKEFLDAE